MTTPEQHNPFLSRQFLKSVWAQDFDAFKDTEDEAALVARLERWAARADLRETSSEAALIEEFFGRTWGYRTTGVAGGEGFFSLWQQFPVAGGAARGGMGSADAALGFFSGADPRQTPQVLCEFKDIRSALDAPQRRKNDNRSPVQQGLGYLDAARRGLFLSAAPIIPLWAIVTDMNEFRLYWAERGERQSIRFVIKPTDLFQGTGLLGATEEARFDRFLFARLFHRDMLTVQGGSGRPQLLTLIERQRFRQRELEAAFYSDYRAYRERLYETILAHNDEGSGRFPGTRGRLVRLAQKILDRCIFVFFCEDMGRALSFPPQLLRDFLIHASGSQYFDPEGGDIWANLKRLFTAMNDGTAFGDHRLNLFNGGLFADDAALDALHIPNIVFCERGQGQNEASLHRNKLTLLYLSATYDYAAGWAGMQGAVDRVAAEARETRSLGLYTLGRIFEQSITELEILEADADGRPSLNREGKRKRDGVYYTPEWIVERIVAETVGPRLAELKRACGWPEPGAPEIATAEMIETYRDALAGVRIVDPACGSGAFLITALRFLLDEWTGLRALRRQVTGEATARDEDGVIRDILAQNIYGVDINPASVEIAKLALWLHTARGNRPLSALDDHIREGNSLIGPEFFENNLAEYSEAERERINAFDWRAAFPEAFAAGGFDAVVGNPPYVKLQNFRKVHADMAAFLTRDPSAGGAYASTQTGNFDLYLPFIEQGLALLSPEGRLGYIAPSLWPGNEYGEGLRRVVGAGRNLWGWIDFGSHQIFDEAITYTALQFYSRAPNEAVRILRAPEGAIPEDPWAAAGALAYQDIAFGDRWLLVCGPERALIDRLARTCPRLDDPRVTRNIFVGIQTSADAIYHLRRLGPGRYVCTPRGKNAPPPYEVRIEDALMKPLVSGEEAKRYVAPETETFLLFPYEVGADGARLIPAAEMAARFPQAWAYLRSYEEELRARERGGFDDEHWWRFGRHQNLDKQEIEKLIVAQLVPGLRVCADPNAALYLNNVRVNGIEPARGVSLWYLLGVLNSRVADFVFRRIGKPKGGGYFEANKQFIAPLPVPEAAPEERAEIARRAEALQALHTERSRGLADLRRRAEVLHVRARDAGWLFADLPSRRQLEDRAPRGLDAAERRRWAKTEREAMIAARIAALDTALPTGARLEADFHRGELRVLANGAQIIDRVFEREENGAFILAQWRLILRDFPTSGSGYAKRLVDRLLKITEEAPEATRAQIVALAESVVAVEARIAEAEREIDATLYRLYGLTPEEIAMVEVG